MKIPPPFLVASLLLFAGPCAALGQTASLSEGLAQYRAGNPEAAIPLLEQALARDSLQMRAYVGLTSALLQTGAAGRALHIAGDGLRFFPDQPALRLARAEALMQRERWKDALQDYRRVAEQREAGTQLPGEVSIEQVRTRVGQLHRLVGQTHARSGETDSALRHFREARSYLPDSASAHVALAALYLKQENWQAADKAARRGLERVPNHARLLRIRTEALSSLQKTEALLPVLQRLYQLRPEDVDVGIAYGRALVAEGTPTKAQEVFDTLLERHPRETKIYDALIALNERQLNYEGVLEVLRRQRRQFPEDQELAMRIGRVHEKLGNYEAARAVYDSTRALVGPGDFSPTLARAQTFAEQDSLESAATTYRRVLEQEPEHIKALRGLGEVFEEQSAWPDALSVYKRLLKTGQDGAAYAHFKLGTVYEELGHPTRALRAYRSALERGTDHPLPYYRYAVLLHRRPEADSSAKPFESAERALRKSLRAVKDLQEKQYRQLRQSTGNGGMADGLDQRAESRLKTYNRVAEDAFAFFADAFPSERTEPVINDLLDQYKDAGRLHFLTATYYRNQGQQAVALEQLRQAVREESQLRAAHLSLGRIYQERGDFRKAVRSFERARTLEEESPDAYRALLELHETRGRLDTLIRRWETHLQADPQNDVLREHLIEALHKAGRYNEAQRIVQAAAGPNS